MKLNQKLTALDFDTRTLLPYTKCILFENASGAQGIFQPADFRFTYFDGNSNLYLSKAIMISYADVEGLPKYTAYVQDDE